MSTSASQHSLARRWAATLTTASLVIVGLLGVTPAAADELAPEPPAAEQVVEPAAEPAVEPAPEPAPSETPAEEPAEEPAVEPSPEPTEVPEESTDAAARGAAPESFSTMAAATPTVTVTPNTDVDVTVENTFTIAGSGFEGPGAAMGVYVLIGAEGNWPEGTPLAFTGWLPQQKYVSASQFTAGSWSTTITVPADTLSADATYIVATSAAHALSATDRTMDTRTPFTTAAPVVTPPVTPTANISVTPTTNLQDEATVTITGDFPATVLQDAGANAGTPATTGVYLMYCVQPAGAQGTAGGRASGAANCDGGRQQYIASAAGPQGATVAGSVAGGRWTFSQSMNVTDSFAAQTCLNAASASDGALQCGVFVRLYHGFSAANLTNPYVYDQFVPVTFAAPDVPGTISVTPTTNLQDEAAVTIAGSFPATVLQDAGANAGTAATTGVYLMYCVQPAGTPGTAGGRASGAANCDGTRQQYIASAAGPQGATVVGSVANGVWTFSQTMNVTDTFAARTCLNTASASDGALQCGIFVRLYHGFSAANLTNPYKYDQFVPVSFTPPSVAGGVTVTPTTGLADEATVTITGDFPATVLQDAGANAGTAATTGVYLMYCVQPSGAQGTAGGRASGAANCDSGRQQYIASASGPQGATVVGSVANGRWTFQQTMSVTDSFAANTCLTAASASNGAKQCGIFVRLYHGFSASNLANPYVYDQFVPVTFAAAPTDPGTPTNPTNPTNPTTPAGSSPSLSVTPGSVDPRQQNTFTVSGSGYTGPGAANGVYVNIGSAATWQPGQVPSQSNWLASAWVTPSALVNGSFSVTLTVPANTFVGGQSYGAATFAAHELSLTNRTLDRWAPITVGGATTATTASVRSTPAPTPPATTGAEPEAGSDPKEGEEFTVTASGFQPNETDVLVVMYSTPTLLGMVNADANGVVTWTGILPRGLNGEHTFTFQGSVDRGVVLDIAPADVTGCPVDGATLDWGFKETFRSYISGSIANGEWVVGNGATYETPTFGWADGTGGYDAEAAEGDIAFIGSITFTGHGGILNTTVANPRIVFDGVGAGTLLLDVSGTTQEGDPINQAGVEFATLDLSGAVVENGNYTVTDAPATLTADGATAFGTYPEGEELDPVSFGFTLAGDCSDAVAAPGDTVDGENTSSSSPNLWWVWLLGGIVLLAIIATVILLLRRRTTNAG